MTEVIEVARDYHLLNRFMCSNKLFRDIKIEDDIYFTEMYGRYRYKDTKEWFKFKLVFNKSTLEAQDLYFCIEDTKNYLYNREDNPSIMSSVITWIAIGVGVCILINSN